MIEQAGFDHEVVPDAGVVARATPPTMAWLRADMTRPAHLDVVVTHAVGLAAAAGFIPPDAVADHTHASR